MGFGEAKNGVPAILVHGCHQCVREHGLSQFESSLQGPGKTLEMPSIPSPHTFIFVPRLQTEKGEEPVGRNSKSQ